MSIISNIKESLSHYTWDLAYGIYDPSSPIQHNAKWGNLHFIKNPYREKWFADPFILSYDDRYIHLLVEEFDSGVNKGRIAHITIDKNVDLIIECHIVLELDTHLSFPAIYKMGDTVFVHPENSESGRSYIYRYDQKNDKLIDPILVANKPLVDAIIRKENEQYLMYATKIPNAGGKELDVYVSDKFLGQYNYSNTIHYKRKEARMAGSFLYTTQGLIRPAQDCNYDYGEAIHFYKEEDVVYTLRPQSYMYEGLHTFNSKNELYVIDLKKYDKYIIHRIIKSIVKWLKK